MMRLNCNLPSADSLRYQDFENHEKCRQNLNIKKKKSWNNGPVYFYYICNQKFKALLIVPFANRLHENSLEYQVSCHYHAEENLQWNRKFGCQFFWFSSHVSWNQKMVTDGFSWALGTEHNRFFPWSLEYYWL